jgi:hypothetical protein
VSLIEVTTLNTPQFEDDIVPLNVDELPQEDLLSASGRSVSAAVISALMAAMTFGALTSMAIAFGRLLRHI